MMSSHQIAAMAMQQQAMFGNFQSYAQQITPPYGAGPGMGALRSPGLLGGYQTGSPPAMMPPPPPMPGWNPGYGGGMMQMAMAMPYASPSMGMGQAMGEQLVGSALGGLSTVGSGLARVGGYATMGAGVLSMAGIGGMGMAALGGGLGGIGVLGLEAGAWGAEQLYSGFRERQQVNRVLRQRFGGMMGIGGGRGGMGFSTQDMGQISSMVRGMAADDMYTSFDELTRLMDRTAQMGLYRGVQGARQFQTRFRETVGALREIAQVMHTSLEGATQFMEQARGQGFFSGRDISATLTQARMASGASGISMDQMMAIRSQGTQMGRMMGMRGRQGATAMQNMAANIGVGMQGGFLSDELIAEMTGGLTGAEGAQAAAGMMMQSNAQFFRRGAGRALLAGLWDPSTGGINMERAMQAMGGGMTFRQALGRGRANIAATGGRRSEFFANEERIAGQLQETGLAGAIQFGMLQETIQRQRGVSGDDPIGERWIRRQSRWDQNQFEMYREMYRNMPQILQERQIREAQTEEASTRARAMEGRGIGGAQRRMQHWWENEVRSPVRAMGDRLVTQFTTGVERIFDQMEGTVRTEVSARTKELMAEYAETGTRGKELMSFQRLQEMRRGLRTGGYIKADEGGMLGAIGRRLGLRAGTVDEQVAGISAYKYGLGARATREEKTEFLNQFYEGLRAGPAALGLSDDDISAMGKQSRSLLTTAYGTGTAIQGFRSQMDTFESMTGAQKDAVFQRRIDMYIRAGGPMGTALSRASGDRARQLAILRTGEEASGLVDVRAPVEKMMGGRNFASLQEELAGAGKKNAEIVQRLAESLVPKGYGETFAYEKQQAEMTWGDKGIRTASALGFGLVPGLLLSSRYFESEREITQGRKVGLKEARGRVTGRSVYGETDVGGAGAGVAEAIFRDSRYMQKSDLIKRFAGSLNQAMSNAQISSLMIRAANGDTNALDELNTLKNDQNRLRTEYGIKDAESLGNLVAAVAKNEGNIRETLREAVDTGRLKDMINLSERLRESGRSLRTSLGENRAIIEAMKGVSPETAAALKAVAEAQASGDYDLAVERRERFFGSIVGKPGAEELMGALSADPNLATKSLGVGMQRSLDVYQRLTGKQSSREALMGGLREAGLGLEALGGEEFRKIGGMRGLIKGLETGAVKGEDIFRYFKDKGTAGAARGQQEDILRWIGAIKDKVLPGEALGLSRREGAEVAERGATATTPMSRQQLAEKQVSLLEDILRLQTAQAANEPGLLKQQAIEIANRMKMNITIQTEGGGDTEGQSTPGVIAPGQSSQYEVPGTGGS